MTRITTEEQWRRDGAPHALALPIAQIHGQLVTMFGSAAVAEAVGTLGDPRHLSAKLPEDHCPFSQTGWPIYSPYPAIHAIDDQLPGFRRRYEWYIDQRRRGWAMWVKYINLDHLHYSWQPTEARRTSTDDPSHGHLSIRSDWTLQSIANDWPTQRYGYAGAAVRVLQKMLNIGHGEHLTTDGIFLAKTQAAVQRFQERRKLTVDGVAGPMTRIALAVASS